jgi:hypothetical protein
MCNFIPSTEYDVHMHAKFEYLDIYRPFVINYFKI